jgi:hypothetical protein
LEELGKKRNIEIKQQEENKLFLGGVNARKLPEMIEKNDWKITKT